AYRDNEVTPAHPLMRKLDAIKTAGGKVAEIRLAPLAREHFGQLIADALRCEPERAAPLAQLVHEKTVGNPFFGIQFMSALADEGMLTLDHDAAHWSWDLDRIHAKGYADNAVDLLVGKLQRLPAATQKALQQLACIGHAARITTLCLVSGTSAEAVHADLWAAVRQELVLFLDGVYRFAHDRVQEAAYALIPVELRAAAHLYIGRQLVAHTKPEQREKAIFEIVNQLNRGVTLITDPEERAQLAQLDLIAGKRAKASTAYVSALTYLSAGAALLQEDAWDRRHELAFALEINTAESEFLTGELIAAEGRLAALSTRVVTTSERAAVACLRIDVHTTRARNDQAIAVCLDYLRHFGTDWSAHPTEDEARREYERIRLRLEGRTIEELIDLPLMSDQASLATLDVLTKTVPPAMFTDANLTSLIVCKAVDLSLQHGNCDGSSFAYVMLGMIARAQFRDVQAAVRFGQLGYDLVEKRGLKRFQARTCMNFGNVVVIWTRHLRAGRDLLRRVFETANQIGDLTYAAYSCIHLNTNLLAAGDPLTEVQGEIEHGLMFAHKAQFGLVIDIIATQLAFVRTLRGLTPKFGCFDDEQFNEVAIERRFACNPALARAECLYWVRKLQARFFASDYMAAVEASAKAQARLWTSPLLFETVEYHFYSAISCAVSYETATGDERQQLLETLADHHQQLAIWEQNCPENFENRAALVGAEIARIEGRILDAEQLYEQAISSAHANGFVHNEALANELAGRFYAARGFQKIARVYLKEARYGYLRWGAGGKVRQLDELYPHLTAEERAPGPTSTIRTPVEQLDLATVLKVLQAVSGEIVLDKLLDTVMRTALEQAGAERCLLIISREDVPYISAEATTSGHTIVEHLRDQPVIATALPETIIQTVLRTRETVILGDARTDPAFAADPYIRQSQARSIFCLPLLNQSKLIGVLYLENNLAPRVFAPSQITVLKLLASQAAISLENTRLYRDLAEREAKIRRLVDANIIGICIFALDGRIIEANEAFLHMLGYERQDLVAGHIRWTDLTVPEWRERFPQEIVEMKTSGILSPFEKEYFHKDGRRVPVLIGAAMFEDGGAEGVAFVLDLTERKRAEAEARESERRYREVQTELAHANRLTTMGQITASIAHEVKQPIAASVTNALAALRWLDREPPDLEEVRQGLGRIVNDGNRAGDVMNGIGHLVKKAAPREDAVDINAAIREVIELTRGEATKIGTSVQVQLKEGLPLIKGDRVQLQQVVLNLVVNALQALDTIMQGMRAIIIATDNVAPDNVLVAVVDTGPGLAEKELERVFDPFYTTKPDGLGMGLAICRSIIEAHGGQLSVRPNQPRGAVFQFTVPAHSRLAS
ncbi:MAG: GAF domain-containing protein, partial [Alphaproteobacteria bacterium]|nr:GAF domain-containing protein [Alphaproteobacteria bacterium]